jgi:hypothetical protein
MNTGAVMLTLNLLMIQNIPAAVWLALNAGLMSGVWLFLRQQKVDKESTRITNHILLLLGTWCAISICVGLFVTFEVLELAANARLFDGFLYGLRVAMTWNFMGVVVLAGPLLFYFRYGRSAYRQ